jgi:hypothetical protein
MRTKLEIQSAITQLRDAFAGAEDARDEVASHAIATTVRALAWVMGDDKPHGFGEMLRKLKQVDAHRDN